MSQSTRLLKRFLLSAVLWLPLAFIGWAVLAPTLAIVPGLAVRWLLTGAWPELFSSVVRHGATLEVGTALMVGGPGKALGQLVFSLNTMMYGYSLPLLAALVLATPMAPSRRALQWLAALPLLWLAQVFGLASEGLRILVFNTGSQGAAAAAASGLSPNAVALAYQFGYLIMPAVLPVVLWVLMNRRFIESLGRPAAEPASP
ncbi:MAG TPA: exosortase H-associated membrane protein [Rhodanobacteraceae bacterium]|nr:exosortase H-associated membrane protein [Rhodanobacteraceae bacterium]